MWLTKHVQVSFRVHHDNFQRPPLPLSYCFAQLVIIVKRQNYYYYYYNICVPDQVGTLAQDGTGSEYGLAQ